MSCLIFKEESYKIQGAIFEVYKELGCGFLESVYQEALELEFTDRNIPYKAQPELDIDFKKKKLDSKFKPDFICYDKIILELKAVNELIKKHEAQVFNYLKAAKYQLGFLINFGHYPKVKIERIISPEYFLT
ncbi:MAG: GxxExxY protein [Fidelibacterota bacterium]